MRMRRLGDSGLQVSEVGLGCNNFGMRIDAGQTQAVVDAALDAGITLFDTADIYGGTKSEAFLGRALGKRRHEIVLAADREEALGHMAQALSEYQVVGLATNVAFLKRLVESQPFSTADLDTGFVQLANLRRRHERLVIPGHLAHRRDDLGHALHQPGRVIPRNAA